MLARWKVGEVESLLGDKDYLCMVRIIYRKRQADLGCIAQLTPSCSWHVMCMVFRPEMFKQSVSSSRLDDAHISFTGLAAMSLASARRTSLS